jgi:hypothetical protein
LLHADVPAYQLTRTKVRGYFSLDIAIGNFDVTGNNALSQARLKLVKRERDLFESFCRSSRSSPPILGLESATQVHGEGVFMVSIYMHDE